MRLYNNLSDTNMLNPIQFIIGGTSYCVAKSGDETCLQYAICAALHNIFCFHAVQISFVRRLSPSLLSLTVPAVKVGQGLGTRLALYNVFCFHAVQTSFVPPSLLLPTVPTVKDGRGGGAGNEAGADRNRHMTQVHWHYNPSIRYFLSGMIMLYSKTRI